MSSTTPQVGSARSAQMPARRPQQQQAPEQADPNRTLGQTEQRQGSAAGPADAGTPSASAISNDSDMTNGQWWLPQPQPSLNEEHQEWRPAVPLAEALQCSVCRDLLKEAITAAECGHSYCYDCIDRSILVGGKANFCPVCNILLGPNPWEHNKLKYDFMLDSIVRKVFPRPLLDAALEARRLEREEATRQAKANLSKRPSRVALARVPSTGQLAGAGSSGRSAAAAPKAAAPQVDPEGSCIELALFPLSLQPGSSSSSNSSSLQRGVQLARLARPYLRVPVGVTLPVLRSWLVDRLAGKKADAVKFPPIVLHCGGQKLPEQGLTMQEVHDSVWKPYHSKQAAELLPQEEVMLMYYSAQHQLS